MQTSTDTAKSPSPAPNVPTRFYTTGDFVDLINALREFDPGAASHTLVGLLRMASENTATPVEQTALRIAGLGDIQSKNFVLTDAAKDLLYDFSTGDYSGNVRPGRYRENVAAKEEEAEETDYLKSDAPEPVARLNIGGTNYVIGELAALDMLAFRLESGGEWHHLSNTVEDGWSSIAAEIIAATRDTTREYIRMHMIHRRNVNVGDNIRLFDLYGFEWFIRIDDQGCFTRVEGRNWEPVNIDGLDIEEDLGKIAVNAIMVAVPDAREYFKDDVDQWARRIAAGAMVMPAFNM